MKHIGIGLLGCGTVGTGVVRLLQQNQQKHENFSGRPLRVEKILVSNIDKERAEIIDRTLLTTEPDEVLKNPDIDIVVEVMGGMGLAKEYVLRAMNEKKNIVTANKDLMAMAGEELFTAAAKNDVDLLFEASVAGGIPIITPLKNALAGNKINKVMGIINGTTNFILTKMYEDGSDLSEVLSLAQQKGYAETDPTADIEGLDAARKIAILASIAFNTRVTLDDVYVEGITKISSRDIEYAKELNCTIKLVGLAQETNGQVEVRVHPMLLPLHHPLAKVDDIYNAVYVEGDAVGDVMFQGLGAGAMPTASAVVGDILQVGKNIVRDVSPRDNCSCYQKKQIIGIGDTYDKYFIRMTVADRPGVLAQIAGLFGDNDVSIDSVIQKKYCEGKADLVLITEKVQDRNLKKAIEQIKGLESVHALENLIRVEKES